MDDRLTARELRRVERIKSALALEESLADDDDYDDDEIDAAAAVVRPDEAAELGGVDDVDIATRAWSRRVSEDRSALNETRSELKATKKRWRRLRLVRKSAARATGVHGFFSGKELDSGDDGAPRRWRISGRAAHKDYRRDGKAGIETVLVDAVRTERSELARAQSELESSQANLSRLRMLRKEAAAATGVHGLFSGKESGASRREGFAEYEQRVKRRELMYHAAPRAPSTQDGQYSGGVETVAVEERNTAAACSRADGNNGVAPAAAAPAIAATSSGVARPRGHRGAGVGGAAVALAPRRQSTSTSAMLEQIARRMLSRAGLGGAH